MDPEAALVTINDSTLTLEERAEAAINMLVWLSNGGSMPLSLNVELNTRGTIVRTELVGRCESLLNAVLDRPTPFNMERYV